jgi:hypothetical protein
VIEAMKLGAIDFLEKPVDRRKTQPSSLATKHCFALSNWLLVLRVQAGRRVLEISDRSRVHA